MEEAAEQAYTPVQTLQLGKAEQGSVLSARKYKCAGGAEIVQYYRVLCIFSKHYNNWFVHLDEHKIRYIPGSKTHKIFSILMSEDGEDSYSDVKLEKGGEWSPKAVYRIAFVADVTSVSKLQNEDDLL